jgi:hypothetical protein
MANGKIVYPSGDLAPVTYTFVKNYDYEHEVGYVETDDDDRALDGTLNSYIGPRKKTFDLTFSYVEKAQLEALQLAWEVGSPVDLYLDGVNLDAVVKIMTPPIASSQAGFVNGVYTYSFDLNMEEV